MADISVYNDAMDNGLRPPIPFSRKKVVWVQDSNNSAYNGSQVNIDTSTLSNSGDFINFAESYLAIPCVMSLSSTIQADSALTGASPYCMGMKNGSWQLIDSLQVSYNGVSVVQSASYSNIYCSFKAMTTWAADHQAKYGASLGFWKDTSDSWLYAATGGTGAGSNGFSNNRVAATGGVSLFVGATGGGGNSQINQGLLNRMKVNAYASAQLGTGLTYVNAATVGQGAWTKTGSGATAVYYWSFIAKIMLRDLHDFFDKLPLVRGAYLSFQLNINTATATIGSQINGMTVTNMVLGQRTCPFIVASPLANQPSAALAVATGAAAGAVITASLAIGPVSGPTQAFTAVRLYAACYTLNDAQLAEYLSSHPTISVKYDDIYSFQTNAISSGSSFSTLLTNGITNPKRLVVVPIYNSASNGSMGFNELQSCFSTAPATSSPLAVIQNFQVQLAGVNVYQNNQQYTWSIFMDEITKEGLNGGNCNMMDSGLISEFDWNWGYSYYLTDLHRRKPSELLFPLSVQIQGTNLSAETMDLYSFVSYERNLKVELATGKVIN